MISDQKLFKRSPIALPFFIGSNKKDFDLSWKHIFPPSFMPQFCGHERKAILHVALQQFFRWTFKVHNSLS